MCVFCLNRISSKAVTSPTVHLSCVFFLLAVLFQIVMALFILVSSPATLISLWFNTLISGLAVVALYAVLGCTLSQRTHRALLPVFVVVSFWAYTTYPLILLAVCLVRTKNRSFRDLFGLMTLFVLSFALAILLTYTLNWQVHGVFGVPLDEWRNAAPATGIAGLIDNLPVLLNTFKTLMVLGSYNFIPAAYFHVGLLIAATIALIRLAPREALYLHAGLLAGLALSTLQVLKLGAVAPPRAFIFAWIFYAVIVVRAAALLSNTPGLTGRIARNLSLLVVLSYMCRPSANIPSIAPGRPKPTPWPMWCAATMAPCWSTAMCSPSTVPKQHISNTTSHWVPACNS
jgi:hypothetical protein